ncbi:FMRFamide-activated amiloride-sensitive sodium channel [Paragonimus heterotremus]|uniref:FMRFamide-activated amiloride-sensitive sodium channel n=1 Tax=Paragonimus heterotremus TaxID=100268 RepID=A0A8J4SVG9_9TREM|nr:FMRFamide-activated amiloride-sensitive sodium channel [Paragonimus heterotremus]
MTYLNGSKPVATPCDEGGRWRKFIHAQYLNCATFEPFVELRASTTNIEMYIYLNEMSDHATCPDCFRGEVKSQLSGALIVIDSADHLPNVNDKSINLKPGSLTEIRLSIIENVQKQPPHGRCSPNLPKSLPLYDTSYAYSEYACRQYTIQNDINQKCGCYSLEYPYNEHDGFEPCSRLPTFVNLTSCSTEKIARSNVRPSVSDSSITDMCTQEIELFTKRMLCKRSVMENYVHGALPSCTMPCAFYSYEAEQSTSSWPTKTWQLTWLNSSSNRRLGIFQGPEFEVYREAQRLLASGNETGAAHLLDNANVLERNLLAVLINRPNFDVRKVEEKEVLSLTSLLSQSGGLFSIWLGLSMIALGEIAEFLVRCYTKTMENRQAKCTSKHQTEPSELNDRKIAFGNHRTDEWKNQLLAAEKWPVRCSENHFLWILLLNYIKAKSEHKENSLCMIQTQYQEIKCEDFGVRGNHQLFPGDDAQQKQQGQRDYSCEF